MAKMTLLTVICTLIDDDDDHLSLQKWRFQRRQPEHAQPIRPAIADLKCKTEFKLQKSGGSGRRRLNFGANPDDGYTESEVQ
jgi:hypothetical protein